MRPEIFLHIGMHKTGTTFLQHLFRKFRKQLFEADGLLFPETGLPLTEIQGQKPKGVSGHNDFARRSIRKTIVGKLAAEIASCGPERVLISAENLNKPKPPEFVRALVQDLERIGPVSIILVVRRQDKWIDSYYRQRLRKKSKGETRDFRTYLKEEGPHLLDYGVRYQPWRQAPFSGRFLAASYDDLSAENRLLGWFCEILHVSNSANSLHLEQVPANPSISRLDAEITRLVNCVPNLDRVERNELLRRIHGLGMLPDAPFVSAGLYEELRASYEPKNKQLVGEWSIDPGSEFINWRRNKKRDGWTADLNRISCKLTAASNGLQVLYGTAQRKKRQIENLLARSAKIFGQHH